MGGLGHRTQHGADFAGDGVRVGDGADALGPGPVVGAVVSGDVVADGGVAAGYRQARAVARSGAAGCGTSTGSLPRCCPRAGNPMRIAISGHRGLPAPVQALVGEAIRAALTEQQEVTGLSCLADGPDQIFARAVLDHGGQI